MERSDLNTTAMLIAAGIEVRIKGQKDLMHLKSYAIDGRVREQDRQLVTERSQAAGLWRAV